jgi:cytochrome c
MIGRILMPLAFTLITLTPAAAASPQEQRGKTFALNNCAKCHSIETTFRKTECGESRFCRR